MRGEDVNLGVWSLVLSFAGGGGAPCGLRGVNRISGALTRNQERTTRLPSGVTTRIPLKASEGSTRTNNCSIPAILCSMVSSVLLGIALSTSAEDVFAGDLRLDQPLTFETGVAAIGDVIDMVGEQLDVMLLAAPAVAEDLLVIVVREQAARDVLRKISEHMNLSWRRRDDGYYLYQAEAHREAEAESFAKELAADLKAAQEQLRESLQETGKRNDEETKALIQALETIWQDFINSGKVSEARQVQEQIGSLRSSHSASWRLAATGFVGLDEKMLVHLATRRAIVLSTDPTAMQHELPKSSRDALKDVLSPSEPSREINKVRVIYQDGDPLGNAHTLVATIELMGIDGTILRTDFVRLLTYQAMRFDHEDVELPEIFESLLPISDAIRRTALAVDSVSLDMNVRTHPIYRTEDGKWEPLRPFAMGLGEVARHTKHSLIAHASDRPFGSYSRFAVSRPTVSAVLTAMTAPWQQWRVRNGWIEVSDRRRAVSRARTIPRRTLSRLESAYDIADGLSMTQLSAIANELSDLQLATVSGQYITGGRIQGPTFASAHLLRFWHSLAPGQRTESASGMDISFLSMTDAQRSHLTEALVRARPTIGDTSGLRWLGPEYESFAREHLMSDPRSVIDKELTEFIPVQGLGDIRLQVRLVEASALGMSRDGSIVFFRASAAAESLKELEKPGALFLPLIEETLLVGVTAGPGRGGVYTSTQSIAPGSSWSEPSGLPAGFLTRLSDQAVGIRSR